MGNMASFLTPDWATTALFQYSGAGVFKYDQEVLISTNPGVNLIKLLGAYLGA